MIFLIATRCSRYFHACSAVGSCALEVLRMRVRQAHPFAADAIGDTRIYRSHRVQHHLLQQQLRRGQLRGAVTIC